MKYPSSVITDMDKIEFAYAAQEKLRLEHNARGKDFRDGVITEDEWKAYKNDRFEKNRVIITEALLAAKESMKNSQRFNPDLDKLE